MGLSFSDPVVGGTVLVRAAIQSPNYVAGVSGWTINQDGTVEFSSGTFRGDISIGTSPNWFRVDSLGNAWSGGATAAVAGFSITNAGNMKLRVTGINGTALELQDVSLAAPNEWPTISIGQSYFGEAVRHLNLTSGQTVFFDSQATLLLRGRRTAPAGASFANLDAQQVKLGSAASSTNLILISSTAVAVTGPLTVSSTATITSGVNADSYSANTAGGSGGTVGFTANNSRIISQLLAGTGATWIEQNIIASNPGGNAGMAMRTSPVAAQIRLGNGGANDVFFTNAGGGAAYNLQAAAFIIFSTLASKTDVAELDTELPDALGIVRLMRPVRYRQARAELLCDPSELVHLVPEPMRAKSPTNTIRNIQQVVDRSTTHLGLVVDDLAQLAPDLIHPGEDGNDGGYSLSGVVAVLVRAVQQLADQVEEHTTWKPPKPPKRHSPSRLMK